MEMTKNELFSLTVSSPAEGIYSLIKQNWDSLSKPLDGLGDFETAVCRIGAMQGRVLPDISKKDVLVFCADNGIINEGVSQVGSEVTLAVAALLGLGKSTLNTLAKRTGARVIPVDIGIDCRLTPEGVIPLKVSRGTRNFLTGPAMTQEEALKAVAVGIELVQKLKSEGTGIIAAGEMGIGNTTTSAALLALLTGMPVNELVGRGAGLCDEGLARKQAVVEKAVEQYRLPETIPAGEAAFTYLCAAGGLDIAALAGVFIGGALHHVPIIIDGVIAAASALTAERLVPGCREYMLASHSGREHGTETALRFLGLRAFINGNMALGEGTGAVMLLPLLDMALDLYSCGTTFSDGGIGQYERFDK